MSLAPTQTGYLEDNMKLFEAIVEANQRAVKGDKRAGVHVAEFAAALPVVALTCIDPRLNSLMPGVLGVPEEQFIWLRNAGNIITSSLGSTTRSLALACAVKGGKEFAIIGHTDCKVCHTNVSELVDRFRALGVDRARLPDNLVEYFGLFASERQNVIKAVDFVRNSPLIGAKVPVHGLLVDTATGKLEWVVNGYQSLASAVPSAQPTAQLNIEGPALTKPTPIPVEATEEPPKPKIVSPPPPPVPPLLPKRQGRTRAPWER
jgi:carbonic anhydrase